MTRRSFADAVKRYLERTPTSAKLFERARKVMPAAADGSGFARARRLVSRTDDATRRAPPGRISLLSTLAQP